MSANGGGLQKNPGISLMITGVLFYWIKSFLYCFETEKLNRINSLCKKSTVYKIEKSVI